MLQIADPSHSLLRIVFDLLQPKGRHGDGMGNGPEMGTFFGMAYIVNQTKHERSHKPYPEPGNLKVNVRVRAMC